MGLPLAWCRWQPGEQTVRPAAQAAARTPAFLPGTWEEAEPLSPSLAVRNGDAALHPGPSRQHGEEQGGLAILRRASHPSAAAALAAVSCNDLSHTLVWQS